VTLSNGKKGTGAVSKMMAHAQDADKKKNVPITNKENSYRSGSASAVLVLDIIN
jgi:hypothetical protein